MRAPQLTRRQAVAAGAVAVLGAAAGAVGAVGLLSGGDESVPAEPTSADEASQAKLGGKLTMYTCCDETLINAFVPVFMQETDVVVDVVQKTAAQMRDLVAAEVAAGRPVADVVWGGDESWYAGGAAVFEKYVAAEGEKLREDCRNETGYVTTVSRDVCAIVVNKALAEELGVEVDGYESLLDEKLAGRVAVADAGTDAAAKASRDAARAVGDLLPAYVTTDEDGVVRPGGEAFLAAAWAQAGGAVRESSADVLIDVLDGGAAAGLVYEQPAAAAARLTGDVEVVLPKEGCLVAPSCCAIVKGAGNLEQARAWMDYACSEAGQKAAAGKVTLRSVRDGIGSEDEFPALAAAVS